MKTKDSKPTLVHEFIKVDDLPEYLKEKFDAYRLSPHSVDFCMRMAAGEDAMTVVKEIYDLKDDRAQIKRKARELLGNPKLQDMITIFRENLKHKAIVDANMLLSRLELMYSEAIFDEDKRLALDIIKEMSKIVTNLDGSISVSDITIKFEVPNIIKIKQPEEITEAKVINPDALEFDATGEM
jgi:hypothetical protein